MHEKDGYCQALGSLFPCLFRPSTVHHVPSLYPFPTLLTHLGSVRVFPRPSFIPPLVPLAPCRRGRSLRGTRLPAPSSPHSRRSSDRRPCGAEENGSVVSSEGTVTPRNLRARNGTA